MSLSRRLAILFGLLLPAASGAATAEEAAQSASFAAQLARLDRALPENVLVTLLPGASDQELSRLQQTVLKGKPVPWDLALLLRWHNGQKWNAPLSNDDNRRLLSIAEIIDEWSFFKDPKSDFMQPWQESWIPVLTNDAGDSVVYETQGPRLGQLITYWHDDARRSQVYVSLQAWAEKLLNEFEHTR